MSAKDQALFTSGSIAQQVRKEFGDSVKSVDIKIKYERDIRSFIKKMEDARRQAAKSRLAFR
ncbi:MAG: hypothetical protein GXP53_01265 [Deltaproteobacteria bacterium]|nr:hypothetical protein [Deltaproteobacteria bacterium]